MHEPCECDSELCPGVLWPMATNECPERPWVERCDLCAEHASDTEAAEALLAVLRTELPWVDWQLGHDDGMPYVQPKGAEWCCDDALGPKVMVLELRRLRARRAPRR